MATRTAFQDGNWSDTSTWVGGVVPQNGDTVYLNNKIVNITEDITIGYTNNYIVSAGSFVVGQWYKIETQGNTIFTNIGAPNNNVGTVFLAIGVGSGTGTAITEATISNNSNTGAGAVLGGRLTMSGDYSIDCSMLGQAGQPMLTHTLSGGNIQFRGSFFNCNTTNTGCLEIYGTGTLTIVGNINTTIGAIKFIRVYDAVVLDIVGNIWSNNQGTCVEYNQQANGSVTGNLYGGSNGNGYCVRVSSTGTITFNGNFYLNNIINSNTGVITNNSTGTIIVNGNLLNTNTSIVAPTAAAVVLNQGTGYAYINGNITTTRNSFGFYSVTSTNNFINGSIYDGADGTVAVYAYNYKLGAQPVQLQRRMALDGVSDYAYVFSADYGSAFDLPSHTNVRNGVSYASGSLLGTMKVPSPENVALNVPVDATIGTAVLTPESVQAVVGAAVATALSEI